MTTTTDRVLIEVATIAHMAGVSEARAGMNALKLASIGAGLAIAGLVMAGKDAVKIAEEHAKAENNLAGAVADSGRVIKPTIDSVLAYKKALAELADVEKGKYVPATHLSQLQTMRLQDAEARVANTTGQHRVNALRRLAELQVEYATKVHGATTQVGNLAAAEKKVADAAAKMGPVIHQTAMNAGQVQTALEMFMSTNRDFISNQNEVINSWAALIREGITFKNLAPLMTTALHIQAAEGGSLADAVSKLQLAEAGRNKGLTTAVGLQLQAVKAGDTYAEKQKKIAANIAAVSKAYKDVKLTPLTIASDHLKTSWEGIAEVAGPELVGVLAGITSAAADFLKALGDPKSYVAIDQRLTDLAGKIRAAALQLGIAKPTAAEDPAHNVLGGKEIVPGNSSYAPMTAAQLNAYFKKNLTKEDYAHWAKVNADKQDAALAWQKDYGAKQLAALQAIAIQVSLNGINAYRDPYTAPLPPKQIAIILRKNSRANDRAT